MGLIIDNITKTFGAKTAIYELSMNIGESERVALMGPSGCGKTTLFRIISGIYKVDSGKIISDAKKISCVFQEPRLFEWLTARENVALAIGEGKEAAKKADKWLEKVGLAADADKYPRELSGGMQQRVAIARALSVEADLCLFDEAFSGLDAELKVKIFELIKESTKNATSIFVTHDLEEAKMLADRIIVFDSAPAHGYTEI